MLHAQYDNSSTTVNTVPTKLMRIYCRAYPHPHWSTTETTPPDVIVIVHDSPRPLLRRRIPPGHRALPQHHHVKKRGPYFYDAILHSLVLTRGMPNIEQTQLMEKRGGLNT